MFYFTSCFKTNGNYVCLTTSKSLLWEKQNNDITHEKGREGVLLKTIQSEAVPQRCSIKKVLIKILQNSKRDSFAEVFYLSKLQALNL